MYLIFWLNNYIVSINSVHITHKYIKKYKNESSHFIVFSYISRKYDIVLSYCNKYMKYYLYLCLILSFLL